MLYQVSKEILVSKQTWKYIYFSNTAVVAFEKFDEHGWIYLQTAKNDHQK